MTETERKAKKKYRDKGKRLTLDFYPSESDLIAQVEKQQNKQGYIKALIRADMEKEAKPGQWIPALQDGETYKDEVYGQVFECSVCGRSVIEDLNEYCPHCGARMNE